MYENAIRNMDSNEAYEIVFHSVNKFILLLGFLSGSEDHYTHSISWTMKDGTSHSGYDFYENERPAYEYKDQYSTNIFSHRTIDIIEQHNFSKVGNNGKLIWTVLLPFPQLVENGSHFEFQEACHRLPPALHLNLLILRLQTVPVIGTGLPEVALWCDL